HTHTHARSLAKSFTPKRSPFQSSVVKRVIRFIQFFQFSHQASEQQKNVEPQIYFPSSSSLLFNKCLFTKKKKKKEEETEEEIYILSTP
ncbi:hypothetical protein, partial [Pseudomonas aeruginosa]|uniref:hypothetical protein n=1 Tax=Pseudomonas aeruginosa TaxID=287 RepID=UPI001968D385